MPTRGRPAELGPGNLPRFTPADSTASLAVRPACKATNAVVWPAGVSAESVAVCRAVSRFLAPITEVCSTPGKQDPPVYGWRSKASGQRGQVHMPAANRPAGTRRARDSREEDVRDSGSPVRPALRRRSGCSNMSRLHRYDRINTGCHAYLDLIDGCVKKFAAFVALHRRACTACPGGRRRFVTAPLGRPGQPAPMRPRGMGSLPAAPAATRAPPTSCIPWLRGDVLSWVEAAITLILRTSSCAGSNSPSRTYSSRGRHVIVVSSAEQSQEPLRIATHESFFDRIELRQMTVASVTSNHAFDLDVHLGKCLPAS